MWLVVVPVDSMNLPFVVTSGGPFQAGEFYQDAMTLARAFITLSVVDSSKAI